MSKESGCKYKDGNRCTLISVPPICDIRNYWCVMPGTFDYKVEIDESKEEPIGTFSWKVRNESGLLRQFTVFGIKMDSLYFQVEKEQWYIPSSGFPRHVKSFPVTHELRIPIDTNGRSAIAEIQILRKKMTHTELEKELGHKVEIVRNTFKEKMDAQWIGGCKDQCE